MNAVLIDTNILVRHFIRDPLHQAELATAYLENLGQAATLGIVPSTVVLEFVFTLERQYKVDRESVALAIEETLQMPGLSVEHNPEVADALADYRLRQGVSFADAYHCAKARRHCDGNLISFDRKLSGIDGVTRVEPGPA